VIGTSAQRAYLSDSIGLTSVPPTGLSCRFVRSILRNMDKEQIIATLRAHEAELHRRGIRHVALFGSVARGVATATSDIDLLIELEPEAPIGVFEYVALTDYIGALFPVRTDIANRATLKAHVRPAAERDAIYAFRSYSPNTKLTETRYLERRVIPYYCEHDLLPKFRCQHFQ
jgi:predicted nucleotidyltransferase